MYLVDSFYNIKDSDFIDQLTLDLNKFLIDLKLNKILILPEFKNYHRYLTHQIVQTLFHDLNSFSLGDKDNRRLIICSKDLNIKNNVLKDNNKMTNNTDETTKTQSNTNLTQTNENENKTKKQIKRPSQHFYVPKARRNEINKEKKSNDLCINEKLNAKNISLEQLTNDFNVFKINKDEASSYKSEHDEASSSKHSENDENSWDNLYDDTGECKDKQLMKQLNSVVEDNVELEVEYLSSNDYEKWLPKDVDLTENEFSHIIEIYDFPVEFKNEHIYNAFKDTLRHTNFDIKWVDDTHCLGVFSNISSANDALRVNNFLLKTRPIVNATEASKRKAQRCVGHLKPYKARPETTSFVASKLIGASLGLGNLLSSARVDEEKKKLQNARDKRRKEKEQQEAIWNGNV